MRWRIQLSYLGTHYSGWQRQPNALSVQQTLEEAIETITRQSVTITGCGRTDTGVHASQYVAHTDVEDTAPTEKLLYQLNAILPQDIAIHAIDVADPQFHARFDATSRAYRYFIHFSKDPFRNGLSFYFPQEHLLQKSLMQQAADLLLQYDQFQPFCKTGSDADHYRCNMMASAWTFKEGNAMYEVRANRFLRGMVRLIVGACLNVGSGKIKLEELKNVMDTQAMLPHAWSVPAEGLYLHEITY